MSLARRAMWASLLLSAAISTPALANPNDISLRALGRPKQNTLSDPAVRRYRNLSNELAAAMAPRPLAPAETLGMSGFEFSVVSSHTPINYKKPYWQGQPGNPVFEGVTRNRDIPKSFWTPTAHLRKGLPLSTEVGISGAYLAFSEMFMLGGEFKLAVHESFHRWIPSLATRIAFARLFGSSDLDITTGEFDVLASIPVGVGGMFQVTPYFGYGLLYVDVGSQVIDETPYLVKDAANDQRGGPQGSLYTFPRLKWNDNRHSRFVAGGRFLVAFVELIFEYDLTIIDGSENMSTYSFKFGFDV